MRRLVQHVVGKDVGFRRNDAGRAASHHRYRADGGRRADRDRRGVMRPVRGARRGTVQRIVDVGAGDRRRDRQRERLVEEPMLGAKRDVELPGVDRVRRAGRRGGKEMVAQLRDGNLRQLRHNEHVAVGERGFHDLDRQHIARGREVAGRAGVEKRRDVDVLERRGLNVARALRDGLRVPGHRGRGVPPRHLDAVQIRHVPVVVLHLERQALQRGQVGRIEGDPRIQRGVVRRQHGRLDVRLHGAGEGRTVSQARRPRRPARVAEPGLRPGRAEVAVGGAQ